jgi:hypothetical protein
LGACSDDVITTKLPVGSKQPMTGLEQADRKSLLPQPAFRSQQFFSETGIQK